MKKILSVLQFSSILLIITNLWVFLYINILQFLNKNYSTPTPVGFLRTDIAPEPFEIPLYIVLTVLFIVSIWLFYKLFPKQLIDRFLFNVPNAILLLSLILLNTFLLFIFKNNIGLFPMAHDIYPHSTQEKPSTYFYFLFIYLGIISVILLESLIVQKLSNRFKWIIGAFITVVFVVIAAVLFEPGFPMVGHDYSYFFGPVYEVLHKKTIYSDVSSQYGFLSILVIAFLTKLHLINIWYLPAINWLLYIAQYFIFFLIIYKLTKSLTFSLIGLFSILTLNYFSLYHLPASIPQIGPIRWLPLVFLIYLFITIKKIDSACLILTLAILLFWIIDVGIFLNLAYFATILMLVITKRLTINKTLGIFVTMILFITVFFIFLNICHLILGYKIINPILVFTKISQYAKAGFGMIPIDKQSYFWFVILIYFASITYFLKNTKNSLLIFVANLSLFTSIYFVGRSHPHNLFNISIFPLLNLFVLLGNLVNQVPGLTRYMLYILCFTFIIVFPAYERQEVLTKMILTKLQRLTSVKLFQPEIYNMLSTKYAMDTQLIKQNLPDKKILILSDDDTYLFYLTGKENYLFDNSAETILTQDDLNHSLSAFFKKCPQKIVEDCNLAGFCNHSYPYTITYFNIQPVILDKIESRCRVKYEPIKCSDHLCISQAKQI